MSTRSKRVDGEIREAEPAGGPFAAQSRPDTTRAMQT